MDKETNEYFGDEDEPDMGYNGYFFELDDEEDDEEEMEIEVELDIKKELFDE
jgi:hypothetical protein